MHITHLARIQLANLTTLDIHHLAARTRLLILSHISPRLPQAINKWARQMMASRRNSTACHHTQAMARKESDTFLRQGAMVLEG
jgi:hypothetical protein